jgi:DNA-binding GntR family transcriptional regulator
MNAATKTRSLRAAPKAATKSVAALSDDDIYERIVSAVLDHRLPPGTKLVEERLAEAFGVSRTRIRPVLARLAQEKVVTITPNRGATVAEPSEQEAHEVFEVRRMIEPVLVERFIAAATSADMQKLTRCIRDEETARAAGDLHRAIRLSGDFHLYIAERSGHQTLGGILRELVARSSLILMAYGAPYKPAHEDTSSCGCQEHRALLAAIRLRDPREATRLMREHLERLEAQLSFTPEREAMSDIAQIFSAA